MNKSHTRHICKYCTPSQTRPLSKKPQDLIVTELRDYTLILVVQKLEK